MSSALAPSSEASCCGFCVTGGGGEESPNVAAVNSAAKQQMACVQTAAPWQARGP
jgi:hypothetical protein